jgi:cytochrome P450
MTESAADFTRATKPSHIADAVVYDFDSYRDAEFLQDAFGRAAQILAEAPPVFWTPRNGGHWMITRYDAVHKAARDWEKFSSMLEPPALVQAMRAALPPGTPPIPQALPANVDPPEHTKFRAPLNSAFSPKAMLALKDDIRGLAAQLIETIKPLGRCEFMSEIAEPLPVQMFMKLFGLPLERQREYRSIVKEIMGSPGFDPQERVRRTRMLIDAVHGPLVERQQAPRNDIISALWQIELDGQSMTMEIMESYCLSLFLAGLDTVMNAMGHGVRHLALDPELQAQVREHPKLIPATIEEMMRLYSIATPMRVVTQDTEFEGVTMLQGERVLLFLPAADLDPDVFPSPRQFDLKRESKAHMAFGGGPHRCLGAHLARIELQVFYEELLSRLPPFRLDPGPSIRYHGGIVIGLESLHLIWQA